MAVSIQLASKASWSGTLDSVSPFGHNLSVTVAAGSNSVLVFVGTNPGSSGFPFTAPTFNGVSMTLLGKTISTANNGDAIYYMVNPPVGTYNLFIGVGSWYGQTMFMSASVFDGVNQTTPFGAPTYAGYTGSSNPLNINITASAAAATLYAASEYNMPSFVAAAGQSVFGTFSAAQSSIYVNHTYKLGASTSVGASWTGGSTQAAHMAVIVNAASVSDTTAPALTSPTGIQTGATTATVGATTDEANGTMYSVVTLSATPPSVAQIQAGQDNVGTAAVWAGSVAISSTGAKTLSATGLTASTAYYAHTQHKDAAANDSTVVTSASFTTAASTDATAPTLTGAPTVGTVTSSSIQISWTAGADNLAVTSYETSPDGTTWTDRGNVLTYTFTGLAASTSYTLSVRAKDAAGNVSTPAISVTQSTSAAADTTVPTLTGAITASAITQTTYTLSWPTGADNVAVTSYEYSLNAGSTWTSNGTATTVNITGRTASTTDSVQVRAKDAAGNVSTLVLSASVTLLAVVGTFTSLPLVNISAGLDASVALNFVRLYNDTTGALVVGKTGLSTDASGIVTFTDASIVTGTTYRIDWETSTGHRRMPRKAAT